MTLTSSHSKDIFKANGNTTIFPFNFKVWDETEIKITIEDANGFTSERKADKIVLSENGGEVTLYFDSEKQMPYPTGYKIAITRNMPFIQESDYINGTRINTEVFENDIDRATAERQQLLEQLQRSMVMSPTDERSPAEVLQDFLKKYSDILAKYPDILEKWKECNEDAEQSKEQAELSEMFAKLARAWAESDTPPDPNDPFSKSAKSWAMEISNQVPKATYESAGIVQVDSNTLNVDEKGLLSVKDEVINDISNITTGVLPIEHGGTGGSTAEEARENLGLNDVVDTIVNTQFVTKRNSIIKGHHSNNNPYPYFLAWHYNIPMEHENNIIFSKTGFITASGESNATNNKTRPFRNQQVSTGTCWYTPPNINKAWLQYTFTDRAHNISGMYITYLAGYPTYTPKDWQLLGRNSDNEEWEVIYSKTGDTPFASTASNVSKQMGRMYWFTDNKKYYTQIRFNISSMNNSQVYVQAIRFYESSVPGMDKNDFALYATKNSPFIATISEGNIVEHDMVRTQNRILKLESPVVISGHTLIENSTNYIYLVLEDETGNFPSRLEEKRATLLSELAGGKKCWLYADYRNLNYGGEQKIREKCLALLQSKHTVNYTPVPDGYFEHEQGEYGYPVGLWGMEIHTAEKPRGANSSYAFFKSNSILTPNKDLYTVFPNNLIKTTNYSLTFEVDLKYTGDDGTNSDSYAIILDYGYYSSATTGYPVLMLGYYWRKKCFNLMLNSTSFEYSIPYNLSDNKWHTIALSMNETGLWLHVDGKNIFRSNYRVVKAKNTAYDYWALGRFIRDDVCAFTGYMNNLRITYGKVLYQGADYKVKPKFSTNLIPPDTLMYDEKEEVVKMWNDETETWDKIPMLPIGEIFTGDREHILTDQPTGTYHQPYTLHIKKATSSDQYDANRTAIKAFSSTYYQYPFLTGPTAKDHHTLNFELDEPMAFDKLRLYASNENYRRTPENFILYGSHTGTEGTWIPLLDHINPTNDGYLRELPAPPVNAPPYVYGYKDFSFTVDDPTPYKYYYMVLYPKTVPILATDPYTAVKMTLFYKNSKPEILSLSSYMVGDYWCSSAIPATINSAINVYTPTGNLNCEVTGYKELMHSSRASRYAIRSRALEDGDEIIQYRNRVTLKTGVVNLHYKTGPAGECADNQPIHATYTIEVRKK